MSTTEQRSHLLEGRVWVLRDPEGQIIDDIDVDVIFPTAHLDVIDPKEMGQYALGGLEGYQSIAERSQAGDIIVAGRNFGAGPSRQQAVDCFISLGIHLLLAGSFGLMYKRNAINTGFPVMEAMSLASAKRADGSPWLLSGDRIRIDLQTGEIRHLDTGAVHSARPLSRVELDIYHAGNLFAYRPPEV